MQHTLWILTGPTASDKTEIGFNVAQETNSEIISVDSMLFYRGMDIGTAKPPLSMRKLVRHHFIDIIDPWENYSVGRYVGEVEDLINSISEQKRKFLIVGGSPLYIKGLVDGIFNGPEADWKIRRELEKVAENEGSMYLHNMLRKVDPVKASELHPNDLRRIIRAVEVYKITGEPVSVLQERYKLARKNCKFKIVCITRDREEVYRRINERVEKMFDKGLVEEVKSLQDHPRGLSRQAKQALGYKEVIQYLDDKLTLNEAKEQVKLNTRRFAKRQMTWFRGFEDIQWVEAREDEGPEVITDKVFSLLEM